MKLTKVLSSAAMAAVVVLVSVLVVDAVEVQPVNAFAACVPGRTSTYSGSTYVEFTTVTAGCTWTVPSGVTSLTEVLIVAGGGGGGGGGRWGGGGGAGEVISLSTVSVDSTVDLAVGGGGSAGGSTCALASNGGNSFLVGGSYSATAFGGGGGGPDNQDTCTAPTGTYISGASGGSGGGSGQSNKKAISNIFASSLAATSTPPGYGNQSGSYTYLVDAGGNRSGTGGGGAGANGGSLVVGGGNGLGGKGGNGTDLFHALISEAHSAASASSIGQYVSSASKYYVAGGGAGASSNYSVAAVGGLGGGGSGSSTNPTNILINCTNGTAQTGGGGGNRCAGGSGFVLIKYTTPVAITYTITYNSNSATSGSAPSNGSYRSGDVATTVASNSGTLARTGYSFAGWNTSADGSGTTYIAGSGTLTTSRDLTLYAMWTEITYTITYNSNFATSGSVPSSQTKTYGVDLTVASNSNTLLRTGYSFAGWNTSADGSGTTYIAGSGTLTTNTDFTLYAKWSANSLTVSFDSQGGSLIADGSASTGGSISASPGTPTRTGYTFNGWFAASTGGSALSFPYAHGQTSGFTLFAQWSANALTVTYDSQGGSSVTADSTTTGSSIAASPGTPTRTGYTFTGWFGASSGGTQISFPHLHGQTASFTLFAQWSANSLTVAFDSQGGSPIADGPASTGGSISASPGTPTRTGYTFNGWFAASTGGSALSFPYAHGQTSGFTLFAQWAQSSLYGLGSKTKIGTITTANGVGNTFAAETATSSVSLRYPADGLPAGTVIDVYLVNDLSRAGSLIDRDGGFVVSLVVAWLAADSSVPLTASGKPISMTIANTTIKAGAKTFAIVGGVVTMIGTATSNGSVTVLISEDPEIVVVNPVAEEAPYDGPSDEPVTSPALKPAPVITPIAKLPTGVRNLIPVIPGAPSKISGILNPSKNGSVVAPKVVTPVVNANGKTQRTTIAPVQLRAVPIDAPTAPVGAKIVPIGSMIVASKESPKEAASPVALGEAKATFGGQPITSTIQKSSDGVLLVSSGPTRIALAGFSSNSSAGLATSPSVPLEIATNSFIAATPVQVWLFSTPLLLAETTVDADGNFAVAINIPRSVPSGNHMLQIQGYTYTSSGAAEITSNIGISIVQSTGQTWSITFSPYVASISRNNQVAWTSFVSSQGASVFSCSLTGVSPSKNSKANVKLFENRRISLLTMLKYNGCINVNINAPVASTKSSTLDRTWRVDVQPATSSVAFKWSHNFKIYSSAIDQKQISQWIALVAQNESSNMACSVTGVEPLIQSKANLQLFVKRNESLKKYLLGAGCSLVQFDNPISRNEKLGSRTIWKVEVNALN